MHTKLLGELRQNLDTANATMRSITDTVKRNGRTNLSAGETQRFDAAREDREALLERIADLEAEDAADTRSAATLSRAGINPSTGGASVRDAATYRRDGQHSFFHDLYTASRGNAESAERLRRNNAEVAAESRAISTTPGAGGEFVPPLWLTDEWIHLARPGRVTVDLFQGEMLPAGTDQINIPKIITGTSTGVQVAQNTAISQTDLTTSSVSSPVITIAGGQAVSMQLVEQSPIQGDKFVLTDLAEDYSRSVGDQALNGTGTGGAKPGLTGLLNISGALNTAYTSASPSLFGPGNLFNKIALSVSALQTARYLPPDAIVMHPRRWNWIMTQVDSQNRPAVLPKQNGPFNALGLVTNGAAQGEVGELFGLTVYADPSLPTNLGAGTNQDAIAIFKRSDIIFYESHLRAEAFPQTYAQNLSLFCRIYNYAAMVSRYPQSIAVITGTGTVTPTW